jgi:hypothetical protein
VYQLAQENLPGESFVMGAKKSLSGPDIAAARIICRISSYFGMSNKNRSALLGVMASGFMAVAMLGLGASLSPAQAQQTDISFAEIMAEPNNLELNFAYAIQQARNGRLLSSASTLERLLVKEPGWDDARLLYAAVLYRMGDFQASRRELNLLGDRDLSLDASKELQRYDDKVNDALQTNYFTGQLALGYVYDDNVIGFVDEGVLGAGLTQGDEGISYGARMMLRHRISKINDAEAFFTGSFDSKQYNDLSDYSQTSLTLQAGVEGSAGRYDLLGAIIGRSVAFDGGRYLNEYGLRGDVFRKVNHKTGYGLKGRYVTQDFADITFGTTTTFFERFRNGYRGLLSGYVSHQFATNTRGSLALGFIGKTAKYKPFEYDGLNANATYDHSWQNGSYVDFDLSYQDLKYDRVDPAVITTGTATRTDDRYYARAALGVPLRAMFGADQTHDNENKWKIEAAIYHDQRNSNYSVYDYKNTGGEVKLVWRFDK